MNVQSHLFVLAYLPVVLIAWRVLDGRAGNRAARAFLLCAGALFCGWGSPLSLLVLAGEGTVSYLLGRRIARDGSRGRPLLWAGAALLLAVLAFFKYTGFLLSLTPLEGLFTPPAWLAPLGLSFVTFQQLFWLRDCYDGQVGADVSPLDYACCLTFFATVTCGPITRVGELAPQLRRPAPFSWDDLSAGLYCFGLGLAKKVLVSAIFANGANYGFARVGALAPMDCALTILCYTLQIYFDFSGYCDMASGMARMMGVELPVNFNSPYQAVSIKDFWGRWHITLSRFFRQCVYIPLGGNRKGAAVMYRNLMLIFLLSGLWHGAGWGFIVWGALHGGAQVVERLLKGKVSLPKPLAWLLTFLFVNIAWVFFRADSVGQALALLGGLFRPGWGLPTKEFAAALPLKVLSEGLIFLQNAAAPAGRALIYWVPLLLLPAGLALLACPDPAARAERFRPTVWRAALTAVCLAGSVLLFTGVDTFIYANF
ncbi:MAG: MBOAT family protein [Oscillospiraceae bacterium]|nr:MBOAT family protein [Oscillospiraceae bacterium]